ncbi:MAG: hypothetical protein ACOC14_01375 [Bacillota bacterium]
MPELTFGSLINFLLGLASGFILFSLLYVYFIVRGKNMQLDVVHKPSEEVDQEALKQLIVDKQQKFKKTYKKDGKNYARSIFDLSFELIEDISRYHFPQSPHPTLELSVNEFITLNHYITDRVDNILNTPLLKNTRNVRITRVVQLFEKKKQIESTKVVKFAKNKKVRGALKATLGVMNVFNPAYWFRKLVINRSVDFMSKHIAQLIIAVVGEETSKIYSKKLFDKDIEFDLVEQELDSIEKGDTEEQSEAAEQES